MASGAPTFELQSHSVHSDGELPPDGVVRAAARAGVQLLALTDHDSVEGVAEAEAEARQRAIAFVTGVEISTVYGTVADLHILGYRLDIRDEPLCTRLEASRQARESRAARMVQALQKLGFAVDESSLQDRVASGKTVGRPHIAQAVMTEPTNAPRLAEERLREPSAFLEAYLIEGRPAFVSRAAPRVEEVVQLIHGAGGVAVWAHPFWDIASPQGVLAALGDFVEMGIDGVEAFYVTHTREQTELLVSRCAKLGLLTTGSSDFHGPGHRHFNHFRAFETYGLSPRLGSLQPVG